MNYCRICDEPTHGKARYCDECRWMTRTSAKAIPSTVPFSTPHDQDVYRPIRDVYGEIVLSWTHPWRLYVYGWQKRRHLC